VGVKFGQIGWNFKACQALIKFRHAGLDDIWAEILNSTIKRWAHIFDHQNKTKIVKGQLLPRDLHTIAKPSCNILV
jgi:hypothetical protein